jgi:hypothetical protein
MVKNIIRGLKKRMGFDEEPKEVKTPQPKVKKTEETKLEKLERELAEAQKEEAEEPEEEETKLPSVNEVFNNHEQRLLTMEAKWFRLGGI